MEACPTAVPRDAPIPPDVQARRRAAALSSQAKPIIGRERASGASLLGRGARAATAGDATMGGKVPSFSDSLGVNGSSYRCRTSPHSHAKPPSTHDPCHKSWISQIVSKTGIPGKYMDSINADDNMPAGEFPATIR